MIYRFAQFELDMARFELREAGAVQPLEPQVFTLLAYLVEHRERLVSKNELFEKLWDGRVVTDSTLTSRIKSARHALSDSGKAQQFIKTIHGKGFRFVADIRFAHGTSMVQPGNGTEEPGVATELSQRPSIAVLPFRSLTEARSCDPLADRLAHDLIAELARLRWLLVIARGSSFRPGELNLDPRDVGQLLGARYCLSGGVEVIGQLLTVTTELVDTRTGEVVWGKRYTGNSDDVHSVPAEIKSKILMSLEIQIPLHEAAGVRLSSCGNLDAWSAYHLGLQHMYRFNRDDNAAAAELFEISKYAVDARTDRTAPSSHSSKRAISGSSWSTQ